MNDRRPSRRKPFAVSTFVCLTLTVVALYFAQDVIIPTVLAVLLSFLLGRPVARLERRVGRLAAVVGVVTVAFLVIAGLGYVVGNQIVGLANNLETYQGEIKNKAVSLRGTGSGMGERLEKFSQDIRRASETPATQPATNPQATPGTPGTPGTQSTQPAPDAVGAGDGRGGVVKNAARDVSDDPSKAAAREIVDGPPTSASAPPGTTPANPLYTVAQAQPGSPVQTLLTYLAVVAGPLGTAGVVVVLVVFMLLEREALRDRFIAVISRGNYTTTTRAINDAGERISRYLVAQSIVNGSYGLIIGLGLFLIGAAAHWSGMTIAGPDKVAHAVPFLFPSVVLWGLLCAVLRFIPYVGPAVSSLFPVALALAVYPGFGVAVAVITLFVVVELISNNVMEPWLYGASTGLSTVAILLAAIFWTWLWGSVGLLVATPLTVCMAVIGKYVPQLRFLHVLLGDEDALPPAVSYYQRLLAGDRADATRIVGRVAEADGPAAAADRVYLPALRMARRDRADEALSADDETRIFDDTLAIARPADAGPRAAKANDAPGVVANGASADAPDGGPHDGLPLVVACPAHHRGDEVTLHLLADVLRPLALRTTVLSTRVLPTDVEATVHRERPQILLIGIMPPGGLPQARYLCRRLHKRFPDLTIMVGFWGRVRDFDRLLVGLRRAGATYVLTSMEQARGQIAAMLPKPPDVEPAADSIVTPS